MTMFKFASLENPSEFAYLVQKDSPWRYGRDRGCVDWGTFYQTYGDGLVQHSHDSPIQLDMLKDFLASLAEYLISHEQDEWGKEAMEIVEYKWPYERPLHRNKVQFLSTLLYREGKTVYFEPHELKTSTHPSKRFDKRWHEVPTWADGRAPAIYRLTYGMDGDDYRSLLERFANYNYIREVVSEVHCRYDLSPAQWISDTDQYDEVRKPLRHLQTAFDMVGNLVAAFRHHKYAVQSLESYKNNEKIGQREEEAA